MVPRTWSAACPIAGLVDPPTTLMRPGLMLGVLRTARKVRAAGPPPQPVSRFADEAQDVVA